MSLNFQTLRKGKLSFMIGLPRSGKSTVSSRYATEHTNTIVLSADSIRLAISGQRFNPEIEHIVDSISETMIKTLLIQGQDVIYDDTNSTPKNIRRLFMLDPDAVYYYVSTPADICKNRAIHTNQSDLIPVIDRIDGQICKLILDGYHTVGKGDEDNPITEHQLEYYTAHIRTVEGIRKECKQRFQQLQELQRAKMMSL